MFSRRLPEAGLDRLGVLAAEESVEFDVLGPLQVRHEGTTISIGVPRRQRVLAMLVVRLGEPVSLDELVYELWAEQPPASAVDNARGYAAALRRLLRSVQPDIERVVRDGSGYRLNLSDATVDLRLFGHAAAQGRSALRNGDHASAEVHFERALGCWRGVMLDGLPRGPLLAGRCVAAEQDRARVIDSLAEIQLQRGRPDKASALLWPQVGLEPLREQSVALLARACYQADGMAQALEVVNTFRANLADQLGADPSAEFQQLHRAILNQDSELANPFPSTYADSYWAVDSSRPRQRDSNAAAPIPPPPKDSAPVTEDHHDVGFRPAAPHTLPPGIPDFVAREKEVHEVRDILLTDGLGSAVPVVTIAGPAGVGKTALSVRAAHHLRDEYPDGQLYVDLRGFDQAIHAEPFDVLGRFLRSLGVTGAGMPKTLEERVEVYRSLLSQRRVLVVLDNAATEDQVKPLIPGSHRCGVVVNSRARLGIGMGARVINLGVLDTAEATTLVARVAGAERVQAEPEAVTDLVRLCGCLPLAVRVAAGRLATRPHWTVTRLVDWLRDEASRLDHLAQGGLDVRASIMLSYRGLSDEAQRLLRRLGDLDLSKVTAWVSAALLDTWVGHASDVLEDLFDAQLVDAADQFPAGYTRYQLHDLVRLVAKERADEEEPPGERKRARLRALGSWLSATEAVHRQEFGGDYELVRSSALRWRLDRDVLPIICADPIRWFELEHESIIVMIRRAVREGHTELAWGLASTATRLVEVHGHYDQWPGVLEEVHAAMRRADDTLGEAVVVHRLGMICADLQQDERAGQLFQEAATLYERADNGHGKALATAWSATIARRRGDRDAALRGYRAALPGLQRHRDYSGEAYTLRSIGQVHLDNGDHQQAEEYLARALTVSRTGGAVRSEAMVLFWQGMHLLRRNRYGAAQAVFQEVLALVRRLGDRFGQAQAIRGLGLCHQGQADLARARSALLEALDLIQQPRPTVIEARIRQDLSKLSAEAG